MPMTPEVRQKWTEAWREARKAKDERRKANREKWAKRRDWSDDNEHRTDVAVVDIPKESGGSDSLAELRRLMADKATPLHRRIDCAETILAFEIAPGAGVGAKVDEIAAGSFRFLKSVVDAPGSPEALRFRCLKLIAAVENARVRATSTSAVIAEKRELLRRLVNAERVRAFRAAGVWREAVKTTAWALKNSDDFPWPEGWPGDWAWPATTFSTTLGQAHDVTAFREQLRAVKATNRGDDDWEKFLGLTADE
jgi:hypothetical protein